MSTAGSDEPLVWSSTGGGACSSALSVRKTTRGRESVAEGALAPDDEMSVIDDEGVPDSVEPVACSSTDGGACGSALSVGKTTRGRESVVAGASIPDDEGAAGFAEPLAVLRLVALMVTEPCVRKSVAEGMVLDIIDR